MSGFLFPWHIILRQKRQCADVSCKSGCFTVRSLTRFLTLSNEPQARTTSTRGRLLRSHCPRPTSQHSSRAMRKTSTTGDCPSPGRHSRGHPRPSQTKASRTTPAGRSSRPSFRHTIYGAWSREKPSDLLRAIIRGTPKATLAT